MEQLSLPYRIALVGLLVFGALYLLVLKPKDDDGAGSAPVPAAVAPAPASTTGSTAPGVNGLGNAVEKANGAAAKSAGANAATQAATGGTTSTPASSTPAAANTPPGTKAPATPSTNAPATPSTTTPSTATTPQDPSEKLLAPLDRGHTVVVAFADTRASDDRAVRAAVKRIDRRGGKVDVHILPLSSVGRYEAITRDVTIGQSSTVLVIGSKRTARTIVGFTTTREIDQLVGDVRAGR
ncbi:hypothetical protein DSM112329_03119 [Paraconexibacter sp. AEG42_29]|uniref:Uncharacterized protein n=1 Tax=Paraconexibacter sp. AEG42_29 TaxID=2997339 RepID=A0AAU7AX92_9ACTN